MWLARTVVLLGAISLARGAVRGADEKRAPAPDASARAAWEETARRAGQTPADVERLRKNKVLITNQAFKQVFDPYIKTGIPPFITSDSLLNGFHVLYEESILRLEDANARRLPGILKFIWGNLRSAGDDIKGKPEMLAAARRRAQTTVGTALALLGEEPPGADAEVAALINAEVKRVVAAQGLHKPAWLGPEQRDFFALDYSRYRPRGFYTRSEGLQRYFRAVSWLQSIPFRVEKDEELLAMLLLGRCLSHDRFNRKRAWEMEIRSFFRCFCSFIGPGDDWDILTAASWAANVRRVDLSKGRLAEARTDLMRRDRPRVGWPQINDQVRWPPADPSKAAEANFRIIAAYRTPDAVLFHRTTDRRQFRRPLRPFPDGLEICTVLRSPYARSRLSYHDKAKLLATIDGCKRLFRGGGLYGEYLRCLSALLDEAEPDAPAFMRSQPWQIKSCHAVLGGWAQLRHTWVLQAKQSVMYLGLAMKPAGFVEPEPEFFARMGRFVEHTERLLREAGAFEVKNERLASDLREGAAMLKARGFDKKGRKVLDELSDEGPTDRLRVQAILFWLERKRRNRPDFGTAAFYAALIGKLNETADAAEKGILPENRRLARALEGPFTDIQPFWRRLATICRKLEALAHKQLRGVPFTDRENGFIKGYGEELAGIMLYGGNSYLTPRDDAPRIADVYYNPNVGQYLEVGIGRPRALYVLYPHRGREVLCRGAVMPYYEFRHPSRLTDREWKARLDAPDRPSIPEWVKPIVASGGITAAKLPADE